MFETSVQILLQGLLLGGLYGLFALGQSLMFGVMRLTNTAQGDFIVLGAFAAIAGMNGLAAAGLVGARMPLVVMVLLVPLAFAFLAVYEVQEDVQVLRILHGAQQWPPP